MAVPIARKAAVPLTMVACLFCMVLANALAARAQSITADGTLGSVVEATGGNYAISQGTFSGNNQFHSFGRFGIGTGETATFTGPAHIVNIVGRVTGGQQSLIDGLLRSDIQGASLYLINPAGVVFGPSAALDVTGSFHVATADYLRFADGALFYADPGNNGGLSPVNPAAFGFLSGNPAGIAIGDTVLQVPDHATLSVVGGNIAVSDGVLKAPGGRLNIAAVAAPGEVTPNTPGQEPDLDTASIAQFGTIDLQAAGLDAGGPGGGIVIIRGGRLLMSAQSTIGASVKAAGGSGITPLIDIQITEDMWLEGSSQINSNVFSGVQQDSGDIRIAAGLLEVGAFSQIQTLAYGGDPPSGGDGGDIQVTTRKLLVHDGGMILTRTQGMGDGGDILVRSDSLEITDAGVILTEAAGGMGNAGDIEVTADSISFSNQSWPGYSTGIISQTYWPGQGNAGDIHVETSDLRIGEATELSTTTWYVGHAGAIDIIVNGPAFIQGTRSTAPWGGDIYTGVFANTFWQGNAGSIQFEAQSLEMSTRASLQASTWNMGSGNAGNITVRTTSLNLSDASSIVLATLMGQGSNAGTLQIFTDELTISGPQSSPDPFGVDFSGISTVAGESAGSGGGILIETKLLQIIDRASIASSSLGAGTAGDIAIDAQTIHVLSGSNIIASAFGDGDGGTITVNTDLLRIAGAHPETFTNVVGIESLSPSGIATQAGINLGNAGGISIVAGTVELLDGGHLAADTYGNGDGGKIRLIADHALISGVNASVAAFQQERGYDTDAARSQISTSSNSSLLGPAITGTPGDIEIVADTLTIQDHGMVTSATETTGPGGTITIAGGQVTFDGNAIVSAKSTGQTAGKGGDIAIAATSGFHISNSLVTTAADNAEGGAIDIFAPTVILDQNARISAQSQGAGNAGDITINAQETFRSTQGSVSTAARNADGGNVEIMSRFMVHLVDSRISASVGGGSHTTGGNITIDPDFVILQRSQIIANAFQGRGGNITIVAGCFLADPASVVDASSALGIDGAVDIQAPITNVSGSLAALPKQTRSAAELLRETCAARLRGAAHSSFVLAGRDGLPVEPGGLLPGFSP